MHEDHRKPGWVYEREEDDRLRAKIREEIGRVLSSAAIDEMVANRARVVLRGFVSEFQRELDHSYHWGALDASTVHKISDALARISKKLGL